MDFKNKILPHIISIVVFVLVTVVFYSPIIFGNKILNQHDIVQGLGASQEIIDFRESTGEEALWTNSIFGGMPAYLINMKWSGDLMLQVHRLLSLWLPGPAGATLVACISFYILLLVFKVRPWIAMVGGIAYGLSSFNIISIEAGHMWKVLAIAYMPLVLAGVHLTVSRKYILGATLTALGLALELRSNHLQITYYLLLLLLIYGATQLIFAAKDGQMKSLMKSFVYLIVAASLALCCNLGKIWSVYEYGQYSTRGPSDLTSTSSQSAGLDQDYIFRWSNGILEPITLFIPEFYGGPSVSTLPATSNLGEALGDNGMAPVQIRQQLQQVATYWGKQPGVAGPSYAGAIVILLFILSYGVLDKKHLIWISVAVVLSIVLSWGHNFQSFNGFMVDYFPGYNKFRSVSMTMVIALMCIPLAAFVTLEQILKGLQDPSSIKQLKKAGMIGGGILLVAILYSYMGDFNAPVDERLSGQVPLWYLEALREDRAGLLRADAIRSLILIALVLAALYYKAKDKLSTEILYGIIAILVLFDLWSVDKRYLQSDDFISSNRQSEVIPNAANQRIQQDTEPGFRVLSYLSNPWAEAQTSYFHNSVGGYHGAKMRRYQELIEACLDSQFRGVPQSLQSGNQQFAEFGIINMLNTRYFILGAEENGVIRNTNAYGSSWLVSSVISVNNADEELEQVCTLNTKSTAIIDGSRFQVSQQNFNNSGSINLDEYKPNYLRYRTDNPDKALAVFSEIYYPKGWVVTIDGEPAEMLRANYVLRAVEVPAGAHTVEFRFYPAAYQVGNKVMMASSILLLLVFAGSIFLELKTTPKTSEAAG